MSADNVYSGLLVQYMMPDCCINTCNCGLNLLNAENRVRDVHSQPLNQIADLQMHTPMTNANTMSYRVFAGVNCARHSTVSGSTPFADVCRIAVTQQTKLHLTLMANDAAAVSNTTKESEVDRLK